MTQPLQGIVISQPVANRILLAMDAISEARLLSNVASQTDFNLLKSVWLADYSLELFVPAICDQLQISTASINDVKTRNLPNLGLYLDGVVAHFSGDTLIQQLTVKAKILHSNRARIQHGGTAFVLAATVIMCNDASEYMSVLSQMVFGLPIEEINLSLSIEHPSTRLKMSEAYSLLKSGDYSMAAFKLAEAYSMFESNILTFNGDSVEEDWRENRKAQLQIAKISITDSISISAPYKSDRDRGLETSVRKIANLMHFQQFGVSIMDAMKFTNMLPEVDRSPGSNAFFPLGGERRYSKVDIEFLFDITMKVIWNMQNSSARIR